MSTVISVTAEHIAKGQRNQCSDCPVALAFLAAIPDAGFVKVMFADDDDQEAGYEATVMLNGGRTLLFSLPAAAGAFIDAFDQGDTPEPFSFTVDYPEGKAA